MSHEYEPRLIRQQRRHLFSKTIVAVSILIPLMYTVVSVYFAWHNKNLPAELTVSVFGFFGTELLAVAWRTKGDNSYA